MNGVPTTKIWIVRRGNGKAEVHPSPVLLTYDEVFAIRNLAREAAEVEFPAGTIIPVAGGAPARGTKRIAGSVKRTGRRVAGIPGGGFALYRVVVRGPRFFEYKVTLPSILQYAEGGSKPGVIIDP